jgi:oligopeptide/dipeptide ABC transporter ATP-binding protein
LPEEIIRVEGLSTCFYTEEGVVKALDDVSFSIGKGEILGLVGETGCGKSVTATSILRLIPSPPGRIVSGKILFGGKDLLRISEAEMRRIRGKGISMIFQDPMSSLNPVLRVGFQVLEAILAHEQVVIQKGIDRVIEMFRRVNIPDPEETTKRYPHQFSGGMRQRTMIAMALCSSPKLLIADEPTTALDVSIQAQILSLIKKLQTDLSSSILLISHDLGVIATMAQKVAIMYAGNIVEHGKAEDIFGKPLHPYTKGLLGAIPKLDRDEEWLEMIEGTLPDMIDPPSGCKFHPRCSLSSLRCQQEKPAMTEIENGHRVACYEYRRN